MQKKVEIFLHEKRKYGLKETINSRELTLLKKGVPIQHIMGYVEFFDVKIKVNSNVLIPRYETEEMVDLVSKKINLPYRAKILDLCTGSGFIGLALKKHYKSAKIWLSDISYKALKIAKFNKKWNFKKNKDIKIKHSDLFNKFKPNKQFDLIISNPPYLDKKDLTIAENVKKFEPHLALYAENQGWKIYEKILKNYKKYLNPHGFLVMEINPYHFDKWTKYKNCEILFDINNKPRFVIFQQ